MRSLIPGGNGEINVNERPWYMGKCKLGTAVGGSVTMLQKYTVQQCIDSVRSEYPAANGFTMEYPCPHKCKCWAEFGMTGWDRSDPIIRKACKFSDKGKQISAIVRIVPPLCNHCATTVLPTTVRPLCDHCATTVRPI